jgi:hypothetical protein
LRNATKSLLAQLPDGEDDYYHGLRRMADHIYDRLAKNGETYVLDKTPRYYFIISEIEKLYPDAKFIFLFRHPFAVAASITESFNRGRLGDYTHRIDLFEGPKMLAEGYKNMRAPSIALRYEDLVDDSEACLKQICNYLEIPFEIEMVQNFIKVPVGAMGDQFGSRQLSSISSSSSDKWKDVFSTQYRKKYLERYITSLDSSTVKIMGYDYDEIIRDLSELDCKFSLALKDRWRESMCCIYSAIEIPLLIEKLKKGRSKNKKHYIHH